MGIVGFSIYSILYYLVHSFLILDAVKKRIYFKGYRIFFNVIAVVTITPIVFQLYVVGREVGIKLGLKLYICSLAIVLGLIIQRAVFKSFSLQEFWGIKELNNTTSEVIQRGMYAHVRHPMYLSALLIFWALYFLFPNKYFLSFGIITTMYLQLGIYLEEKKLIAEFGKIYKKYRKEVPKLIPFKNPIGFLSQIL